MRSWFLMLVLCSAAVSQTESSWQKFIIETPYQQFAWIAAPDSDETETEAEEEYVDSRSPAKAFLLSAIVPGAGQAYNRSWLKAAAFLAIEAGSWYFYADYTRTGNDIDTEFKDFADTHWSENEYWDYIARRSGLDRGDVEALRGWEQKNYSHALHRVKDQQYYEMIGKYDQFNAGWDDSEVGLWDNGFTTALRSTKRLAYDQRRNDSNTAFKNATKMATIAILNHLASAAEAAWSSHRFNQYEMEASLRVVPQYWDGRPVTALSLNLTW
jgi:hypothetical protein